MSKKKEFWLRHDDDSLKPRIWDRQEKKFWTAIWFFENAGRTLIFEHPLGDKRFVIQQCIGCKDINGLLIYEGDILETDEAGWIGVVVFGEGRFSLEDSKGGFSAEPNWSGCKIIGNVYQDHELIP